MSDPSPEKIYQALREHLAADVARELADEPKGSKALWLYENLHQLNPVLIRAREARAISARIRGDGPRPIGTGTEG